MKSSANLLLLLLLTTDLYPLRATKVNDTDTDTVDILGEIVNEMSYSDIKEMLGNSSTSDKNGQDHFDVVNEQDIDEELSETEKSTNHTGLIVIIVVLASGPVLFVVTAILYCVVLAYEKYNKKRPHGAPAGGE